MALGMALGAPIRELLADSRGRLLLAIVVAALGGVAIAVTRARRGRADGRAWTEGACPACLTLTYRPARPPPPLMNYCAIVGRLRRVLGPVAATTRGSVLVCRTHFANARSLGRRRVRGCCDGQHSGSRRKCDHSAGEA